MLKNKITMITVIDLPTYYYILIPQLIVYGSIQITL